MGREGPPVTMATFLLAVLSFQVYNLKRLLSPTLPFVKFITFKATMTAFMYAATIFSPKCFKD